MTDREKPAYTDVFLRIEHDTADPETVTSILGLTPTHFVRRGQQASDGKSQPFPWNAFPWNVWVLSSARSVQRAKDVCEHFQWLLEAISSRVSELRNLRNQGHRMAVYCTWIGKGGYGGPVLSPQIMRGLADLEIEVYFDVAQIKLETTTLPK